MADFIKFEQSIVKIDKDGNTVLSDTLYPGEKVSHTGATFTQVKAAVKAAKEAEGAGGLTQFKEDAREPKEGQTTATLDETLTSTIRGTFHSSAS